MNKPSSDNLLKPEAHYLLEQPFSRPCLFWVVGVAELRFFLRTPNSEPIELAESQSQLRSVRSRIECVDHKCCLHLTLAREHQVSINLPSLQVASECVGAIKNAQSLVVQPCWFLAPKWVLLCGLIIGSAATILAALSIVANVTTLPENTEAIGSSRGNIELPIVDEAEDWVP